MEKQITLKLLKSTRNYLKYNHTDSDTIVTFYQKKLSDKEPQEIVLKVEYPDEPQAQ